MVNSLGLKSIEGFCQLVLGFGLQTGLNKLLTIDDVKELLNSFPFNSVLNIYVM